ncbi:hypothetical protein GALMADRAFT_213312 [Galerina marginata CBS 339.88]|uniref:Uncharacterized protein n=1 Tax=Galerina marginata (strain CBS 339.88) TaxID=685588 RepID=A0A067SMY1_GALM3|nr:hypothetical protein GALMADRAFT_213312 [Galerina marginata CBS 339.88]
MASEPNITPAEARDEVAPDVLEMEILNTAAHEAENEGLPASTDAASEFPTSWHPKLTPFRLLNVLIPVSIASAKTITSLRGDSTAPITLEWISGIVVFLVLFHAGYYESAEQLPPWFAWVFRTDCMEYLWRLLDSVSIPRPHYTSVERESGSTLTTYHLLVSNTVVLMGMTKACASYYDRAVASVWVEWVLAAIITSALYIVGLYENNSAGKWTTFFQDTRNYPSTVICGVPFGGGLIAAIFQLVTSVVVVVGGVLTIYGKTIIPHVPHYEDIPQEPIRLPQADDSQILRVIVLSTFGGIPLLPDGLRIGIGCSFEPFSVF